MSNPTSNFNWQMPTATDLVTDLPADFEVFGQAVDTSLADLKGGTAGQFLKKNTNTDMDFVWANAPGKVLQVVYGSTTTQTTSTTTTYADTTLSLSITPSSATSKVMVLATQNLAVDRSSGGQYSRLRLVRGATTVLTIGGSTNEQMFGVEVYASGTTYIELDGVVPVNYLDSPATTSATTYKTQFACSQQPGGPTVTITAQKNTATSTMMLLEIGA
jgi:hypothetical protein